jgi:3-oxoadipate enol-lactonase
MSVTPSTHERVSVRGLSFHCRLDGPPGAPWLMFSNSLLTDLSVWDAQVAALAANYRILRYDQRGHGGTQVPPQPTNLDELVGDAAALLDVFRIDRVAVIGVSMGAATALCLAARSAGRVTRVAASDGQAATAPNGAAAWQERIDFAVAHGMAAVAESTIQRWLTPPTLASGRPAVQHVGDMVRGTSLDGFIACARALQSYDFRTELGAIQQPALLIAGEQDGAMPKTMQAMQAAIPGARYTEIAGAGHLPGLEQPAAFNASLVPFLAET